jgi:hypothetical protein
MKKGKHTEEQIIGVLKHDQGLPGRYLFGPGLATTGYYVSAVMLDGRGVLGQKRYRSARSYKCDCASGGCLAFPPTQSS